MRLLLVAGLILAGCGAAENMASPPGSSGSDPTGAVATTQREAGPIQAPAVVPKSENGAQEAVPGSLCIFSLDPESGEGEGSFGDTGPIHPNAVTGVAAGDDVAFTFVGVKVVHAGGCQGGDEQDCIGSVSVKPLGSAREVERVPLAPGSETRWTVDLEPGAYELDVFAHFESDAGATGDVSGDTRTHGRGRKAVGCARRLGGRAVHVGLLVRLEAFLEPVVGVRLAVEVGNLHVA